MSAAASASTSSPQPRGSLVMRRVPLHEISTDLLCEPCQAAPLCTGGPEAAAPPDAQLPHWTVPADDAVLVEPVSGSSSYRYAIFSASILPSALREGLAEARRAGAMADSYVHARGGGKKKGRRGRSGGGGGAAADDDGLEEWERHAFPQPAALIGRSEGEKRERESEERKKALSDRSESSGSGSNSSVSTSGNSSSSEEEPEKTQEAQEKEKEEEREEGKQPFTVARSTLRDVARWSMQSAAPLPLDGLQAIAGTSIVFVILCQGGRFSGGMFRDGAPHGDVHRSFTHYVSRRKQGGRQARHDETGGHAHSVGASIRRSQEKQHVEKVRRTVEEWRPLFKLASLIYVHAPGENRKIVFFDGGPLSLSDANVRAKVPLSARRATFREVCRIHAQLTSVTVCTDKQ